MTDGVKLLGQQFLKISYNLSSYFIVVKCVRFFMELSEILPQITVAQKSGKIIVLATGVFDLFHEEHKNFLQKAKERGDVLVVGLECDKRVRELKGEGRPIDSEAKRLAQVSHFFAVDYAFILPENFNTPADRLALLQKIKPAILAVSSHSPHLDKKIQLMSEIGGKVEIVHQHNPAVSTSMKIQQSQKM